MHKKYNPNYCFVCDTLLVEFGGFYEAWTCPECSGWMKDGIITRKGSMMKTIKWVAPECLKWHHLLAKMWKEEDMYLIEIPLLNAITQGFTKNDAYKIAKDMIKLLSSSYISTAMGFTKREIMDFKPKIVQFKGGNLIIGSNDPFLMVLLVAEHKKAKARGMKAADEFLLKNPPLL